MIRGDYDKMRCRDSEVPVYAYRIFLVTTAMTSSWAAAERRNVTNIAREREKWYELMVEAYTCLSRKLCTGLFHLRENSSQDVEFHCGRPTSVPARTMRESLLPNPHKIRDRRN